MAFFVHFEFSMAGQIQQLDFFYFIRREKKDLMQDMDE